MPKTHQETERAEPRSTLGREILKQLAALGLLGGFVSYLAYYYHRVPEPVSPPRLAHVDNLNHTNREICGEPSNEGLPVVISLLYSDDKRGWIEYAAERFIRLCPNIQVKLIPMGSIEGADAILGGEVDPVLWAPADDLVLSYLEHRWSARSGERSFSMDTRVSLVSSPLVVLMWEDRRRVLEEIADLGGSREGPWMGTLCPLIPREPGPEELAIEDMVPGRWIDWYDPVAQQARPRPAPVAKSQGEPKPVYRQAFPTPEEIQRWGRVKVGYASPRRTSAGLEAVYLMAYDYVLPPGEREALEGEGDLAGKARSVAGGGSIVRGEHLREAFEGAFLDRKDALQDWLRRCQAGLEAPPETSSSLAETMFNVGPARYDGVVTHENLVFDVLASVEGHEKSIRNVRVLYPRPTVVNQHPIVFLRPDRPDRAALREPASRWIAFLRSGPMQLKAIEHGFRPANPEISIDAHNEQTNPFLKLERYGVSTDVIFEEPPRVDGEIVTELIQLWQDATGRY
ncbi:hypothetical protein BE17_52425 [Sorangium cellulosum]|uniref:ABC transporter substrate-binding protein n=1 Tax=Sorangium cellulosum TaxID=56 RepID=A0A150R988_SORCE|nr:hypothetical protein BE17_52425 [Sorangium cellulosum]